MTKEETTNLIKNTALRAGFDLVGITTAEPPASFNRFADWIAKGMHASMDYLERTSQQRRDPRSLLPEARAIIMLGLNYAPPVQESETDISCYARGHDYHDVMRSKMKSLISAVRESTGSAFRTRICVDTAPLLERDLATRAGLGWIGKNTSLINRKLGTWFFLGAILTDLDLTPDTPQPDRCGRCNRCIQACPTGALSAPRVLDARRCISYLTIEHKGHIPTDLRTLIGTRVFGCDECQRVCPWNRFSKPSHESAFEVRNEDLLSDPARILEMDEGEFQTRFVSSPILRTGRAGLARNAAIALGNSETPDIQALIAALSDADPLVRRHAAWALGRHKCAETVSALEATLAQEQDELARSEIKRALEQRFDPYV